MFYPLLRTIPALTGNIMLTCDINSWEHKSVITHIARINTASLMPLQNSVYNRLINVNLLNDNYEFDITRYYKYYSDIFYEDNYMFNENYISNLDVISNDINNNNVDRNVNYEMGCKRIPISSTGYQFCFFAPFYIDNINDLPDSFIIDINFGKEHKPIHKKIIIPISSYDASPLYIYLKRYVSQIDNRCIFCKTDTQQSVIYGINVKHGGFTLASDNGIGNIFKTYMRVNDVDKILSESFKRTKTVIKQILPLAFMFNVEDLMTSNEKLYLNNTKIYITGHYEKQGIRCDFADFSTNYKNFIINNINILSNNNDSSLSYQDIYKETINISYSEYHWNDKTYSEDIINSYETSYIKKLYVDYINEVSLNEANDVSLKNENTVSKTYNRWVLYSDSTDDNYITNSSLVYNEFNGYNDRGILPHIDNTGSYLWICDDGTIDLSKSFYNKSNNYNNNWFYETSWSSYDIQYSEGWENVYNNKIYYRGLLYDFNTILKNLNLYNFHNDTYTHYINIYDEDNDESHVIYTYNPEQIDKFGVFVNFNILSTYNAYLTRRSISYINNFSVGDNELFVEYYNNNNSLNKYYSTNNVFLERNQENINKYYSNKDEIWTRYDYYDSSYLLQNPEDTGINNYFNRNKYYKVYDYSYNDGSIHGMYEFIGNNITVPFTNDPNFNINTYNENISQETIYGNKFFIQYNNSNEKVSLNKIIADKRTDLNSANNYSLYTYSYFVYWKDFNDEYITSYDKNNYYQYEYNLNNISSAMMKVNNIRTSQLFVDAWNIENYINNIETNKYRILSEEYIDIIRNNKKYNTQTILINEINRIKRYINDSSNKFFAYIKYVDEEQLKTYRKRLYGKNNIYESSTYLLYSSEDKSINNDFYNTFKKVSYNDVDDYSKEYFHYSYVIPINTNIYNLFRYNKHTDFMIYGRDINNKYINNIAYIGEYNNINSINTSKHLSTNSYVLYPLNTHYLFDENSHDKIINLLNSYNIHKVNDNIYVWDDYECDTMVKVNPINETYNGYKNNTVYDISNIDDNNYIINIYNNSYLGHYDIYDTITLTDKYYNYICDTSSLTYSYNNTYSYIETLKDSSIRYNIVNTYNNYWVTYTYYPSYIKMSSVGIFPHYSSLYDYNIDDSLLSEDDQKYLNIKILEENSKYVYNKNQYYSYAYQPNIIKYKTILDSYVHKPFSYIYEDEFAENTIIDKTCYITDNITYNIYNIELNENIYKKIKTNSDLLSYDNVSLCTYINETEINNMYGTYTYHDKTVDKIVYLFNSYINRDIEYSTYSYYSVPYNMKLTYIGLDKNTSNAERKKIAYMMNMDVSLFNHLLVDTGEEIISYIKTRSNINEGVFAYYYIDLYVYPNDISFNVKNNTEINVNSLMSYSLKTLLPFMKFNMLTNKFINMCSSTLVQPIDITLDNNIIYDKYLKTTIPISNTKSVNINRYYNDIRPMLYPTNVIDVFSMLKYKTFKRIYKTPDIIYNRENISIYKYPGIPVITSSNAKEKITYPYEYKFYNDNCLYVLEKRILISDESILTYEKLLEKEQMNYVFNNVFKPYMKQYIKSEDNNEYLFLFKKYNVNFISNSIKLNTNKTNKLYKLKYEFNLI